MNKIYLLLAGAIDRVSGSLDSIGTAVNSTFDFEDFAKVTLTKDTHLDKVLLESKHEIHIWSV